MTENDATRIIRNYVNKYGRQALRKALPNIARDFPGNEEKILNAGRALLKPV